MKAKPNGSKQQEIEKNFAYFESVLPSLTDGDFGRYALLRHEEIISIYDTARDALTTGTQLYDDGLFSIQKVDPRPIDLGAYSHALHLG
ncbi:hypothetical protein [Candidatus Spongiihabitans sp.]|uniref:hypothetical protein n=1 Tax=Candidatus Spongiihabitans sp. TaxID=3101308 RepID=UPI003C7D13BB